MMRHLKQMIHKFDVIIISVPKTTIKISILFHNNLKWDKLAPKDKFSSKYTDTFVSVIQVVHFHEYNNNQ